MGYMSVKDENFPRAQGVLRGKSITQPVPFRPTQLRPEPAVPASTAPPALVEKLPEIRWKKSERKVVAEAIRQNARAP